MLVIITDRKSGLEGNSHREVQLLSEDTLKIWF